MGWSRGRTARARVVGAGVAALIFMTWWLLARGTRGAEIANVLALPAAVSAVAAGLLALRPARTARPRFVGPTLVAALGVAAFAVAALIFMIWLLARGTRGAEIANVLGLPLAVIAAGVAIRASSHRKGAGHARFHGSDRRGWLLKRVDQKITEWLGQPDKSEKPGNERPHIARRFERRPDAVTPGNKPIGLEHGRALDEDEDKSGLGQILANSPQLLVLGDAGSGKTTALFELARDLLNVAKEDHDLLKEDHDRSDPEVPIPVVLDLYAWGEHQESTEDDQDGEHDETTRSPSTEPKFEDWMASALSGQYAINPKRARLLVNKNQLLPLFDGLDRVTERRRDMCVQAINRFARKREIDGIVVSCRSEEYQRVPTRLNFQEAVAIKLPTREEVNKYLEDHKAQGIIQDIETDAGLRSLLSTPLMLDIAVNVYAGQSEKSGVLVGVTGTLEQRRRWLLSEYKDQMLKRLPIPRYFWSGRIQDNPPRDIEANWKSQTALWLAWIDWLMQLQAQSEFRLDHLQPDCLPSPVQKRLVVVLPALCMFLITTIIMTSIIAFSWPFTVAVPWGLLGGVLIGLDGLGWRTLLRRHDRPVVDPVEDVSWNWSRARLIAGIGIGAAAGLAAGLIARLLGEMRALLHPHGVWDSSLLVLQQLGEWPVWPAICVAAIGACAVMSGLGGGLSKGETVPNEGILRSARRALSIGIPIGLFGGSFAGVVIRPIASVYTTVMMSFFFAFAVGLAFGGRACLRHIVLRLLLVYNDIAPLRFNAFLQDSANRLFLRRSTGGYTFFHQFIRDYFAEHYPLDPPHARSAVRVLRALMQLSQLSR